MKPPICVSCVPGDVQWFPTPGEKAVVVECHEPDCDLLKTGESCTCIPRLGFRRQLRPTWRGKDLETRRGEIK